MGGVQAITKVYPKKVSFSVMVCSPAATGEQTITGELGSDSRRTPLVVRILRFSQKPSTEVFFPSRNAIL